MVKAVSVPPHPSTRKEAAVSRHNSQISMVLVFGVMALLTMGARPQRYDVCHKSKGKTYKKMTVREPALKGHLAHGDYLWEEERMSDRCQDGIDNDCNGVVDMDEPICPHDVCEALCYSDWVNCSDICWYDFFDEVCRGPGSDPDCNNIFTDSCDPACLEQVYECNAVCDENYDSCVSECPAAP